jgi:chromosomal replication initiation ATPase DnaA
VNSFSYALRVFNAFPTKGRLHLVDDWARILQHAKRRVNPHNFDIWFHPTQLKGTANGRLLVRVPTLLFKKRLTETYGELLQAVLQEVGMHETELEFHCNEPDPPKLRAILTLTNQTEVLRKVVGLQHKRITIAMIRNQVGAHFGVFPHELKLRNRSKAVVLPRQVAMFLVQHLTTASLPKIGREFGGKHHTTVLNSIKKIEARRRTDTDLNRTISELFDSLREPAVAAQH